MLGLMESLNSYKKYGFDNQEVTQLLTVHEVSHAFVNPLLEKFKELMPGISIFPDFSWAGTFGLTKDALPYMGSHPDFPNSYFVLGFGGNGITFSVMGMEIISDALAGKHNNFLEYFKFKR